MEKEHPGIVVICSYQPKAGKRQELLDVLKDHVPSLRRMGLATSYPSTLMTSENGAVIEIFEWESEQAARSANDNPEVRKIWESIGKVADFFPLSDLKETKRPFAHFKQVEPAQ